MTVAAPVAPAPPEPPSTGMAAVRALRSQRKRNRLGEIEWFEAAYRVYLVALLGGIALAWLSDLVGDAPLSTAQAADAARHGPAVLGVVAVVALAAGARSGSQGGPLALEAADVTYVMLAPVPRRAALARPAVQRVRSAVFVGALVGAALGQLAGRRLPGTAAAWFVSGAAFGATVAALWAGTALVAHALRVPLALSTALGGGLLAWQAGAAVAGVAGPADTAGSLAMWGWRQHGVDLVAAAVAAALVLAGLLLLARTSLDALSRRATLVAQLRFAVTMQDLRTVILLRRQLTHEHTRTRPWVRLGRGTRAGTGPQAPTAPAPVGRAVWRRGWHGLLRIPTGRLVRMAALAVLAGACQAAVLHDITPALAGSALALFVLGLEAMEPLSQEIDQPDRTASYPHPRGELLVRHLPAPAVALLPFAALAGAAAVAVDAAATGGDRVGPALAVAAVLCVPTVLAGAAGAAVSIVRDAPDPLAGTKQQAVMPPEMAGFATAVQTLVPLVVPVLAAAAVLLVRAELASGAHAAVAGATRGAVGLVLALAAVVAWVRSRDRLRAAIRRFLDEGRAHTAQQRGAR